MCANLQKLLGTKFQTFKNSHCSSLHMVIDTQSIGCSSQRQQIMFLLTYGLFGCQVGNANVNEFNLRTLRQEKLFELILFTFALLWNKPNSTLILI
jgi:hypothetical protein